MDRLAKTSRPQRVCRSFASFGRPPMRDGAWKYPTHTNSYKVPTTTSPFEDDSYIPILSMSSMACHLRLCMLGSSLRGSYQVKSLS